MEKKKHHLRFTVIMSVTMAVILAILIVANILLLSVYPVSINNLLSVTDTISKKEYDHRRTCGRSRSVDKMSGALGYLW